MQLNQESPHVFVSFEPFWYTRTILQWKPNKKY